LADGRRFEQSYAFTPGHENFSGLGKWRGGFDLVANPAV
jgi:hypothetical protein